MHIFMGRYFLRLLGHSAACVGYQTAHGLLTDADRALAFELLLASSADPTMPCVMEPRKEDGKIDVRGHHGLGYHQQCVTALHLVVSGGCDPPRFPDEPRPDAPKPFERALLRRLVHVILSCGGSVEARDDQHGATPLAWAAFFGCKEGMQVMVDAGADCDALDAYGSTARSEAWRRGVDLELLGRVNGPSGRPYPFAVYPVPVPESDVPESRWPWYRPAYASDGLWRLRWLHARWAEWPAREAAALGAGWAAAACEANTGSMLPGPARVLVAEHLMEFDVWPAITSPNVNER